MRTNIVESDWEQSAIKSDEENVQPRRTRRCCSTFNAQRPINRRREFALTLELTAIGAALAGARAERINQEGRSLGPAPVGTTPTLLNTSQGDAIASAMQIFPVTNPWNEDVSRRPLLANSATMITQMKSDLSSTRQTLRPFYEMNYVLVPDTQARITIPFLDYPDESDLDGGTFPNGSYPIPSNMPIETWPRGTGTLTLQQWQMEATGVGGDRHGIIVAAGGGAGWGKREKKMNTNGRAERHAAQIQLKFK